MSDAAQPNPAEAAAAAAWEALKSCLDDCSSFVFEAGAGAGKTYSLMAALRYILQSRKRELERRHQQVACITYTNVARDMIIAQTDGDPVIYCDTTHAFAWMLAAFGVVYVAPFVLIEFPFWKAFLGWYLSMPLS